MSVMTDSQLEGTRMSLRLGRTYKPEVVANLLDTLDAVKHGATSCCVDTEGERWGRREQLPVEYRAALEHIAELAREHDLRDAVVAAARAFRAERLQGRVDQERARRWWQAGIALDDAIRALDDKQEVLEVSGGKPVCAAFAWLGQSFASCDECGHPYWEHTHRAGRPSSPFGPDDSVPEPISAEEAAAVRAKWERTTHG